MKKQSFFLSVFALFVSCQSSLLNIGLKHIGAYNDTIELKKIGYKQKNLVFIPMHHIGTEKFYKDVKSKIDSLKELGYFFLYEKTTNAEHNKTLEHKIRKIIGSPLPRNSSYKKMIDSLYPKIQYKTKLIDQPSYFELGLNLANSSRTDRDYKDIINYYENKYGEIKLTDCDFKTSIYEKYTLCREENKIPKKQSDDALIDFRNTFVANTIKKSERKNIAIIYGKAHMEGIIKNLSE